MQDFYIGDEILAPLEESLRGVNKVFIVRGKRSYDACGASAFLCPLFSRYGNNVTEFSDFAVNPQSEDVEKGYALLVRSGADLIIGAGGGSVMDMAKLIRHKHKKECGIKIPLITMPTTAGSGAEATHFAVMYVNGVKQSVASDDIRPDCALLYPAFTQNIDKYLTACSGFDAIAHAIESYWSVNSSDESRRFSQMALQNLWTQLPRLLDDSQNKEIRREVVIGAYYAGKAIDLTTTTAPHAFSYKITSIMKVPHAHAVATTFPYFAALNCSSENLQSELVVKEYSARINSLKEILGCSAVIESDIIEFFQTYLAKIGLNKVLLDSESRNSVVNGFNSERAGNNPVIINDNVLRGLSQYLS